MGRTGALADARLIQPGPVAPGLSGLTSGTALGLLCLACVAWTLARDRPIRSELALEGASHVIQPATSSGRPAEARRRASLTLDTGADVETSPVVNAHLEFASPIASPNPAETIRPESGTVDSDMNRPAKLPAEAGGFRGAIHIEAKPVRRLTATPTD